ncbi:acetolactate synthase large subunit [Pelagibius sp. Alg239-R121]|uniref:acetolactate synthase large subunit n=1 Tax=Pelagibius sp. Alg239-R121 TaxID=2993448 RepID=UPI0024A76D1D|nr:acetolactate synthase large subunit [Pelagibius sp. Alg239-R121]
MNGAQSLVKTLLRAGVDVCFSNPGTSEMHFVAALDEHPDMKCVLGLHETIVTGAADGYARMAGKPAATLLHLGPGLGNGLANLHNAKRARTPLVNIVGDHATYHGHFDAPLTSDVEGIAGPVSDWVRSSKTSYRVAGDAAEAVAAARQAPGHIATLILPADCAWSAASGAADAIEPPHPLAVSADAVSAAVDWLRSGRKVALLLGDQALMSGNLELAGKISAVSGCELFAPTSNRRIMRGAGRVAVERIAYPVDVALERLANFEAVLSFGADEPVAFFAYPDKPSRVLPEACELLPVAGVRQDIAAALTAVCEALGAENAAPPVVEFALPEAPSGAITPDAAAAVVARVLPENAIVIDEAITSGRSLDRITRGAVAHDWLQITGGAIGCGFPLATGASVACPDRPVLGLQADGSGAYSLQALWTQAREEQHVVTLIFANREYRILKGEMRNVGVTQVGRNALSMLDLRRPNIGWVDLARGFGVSGESVETVEDLAAALQRGFSEKRPYLIEAVMP